jgi:hypothetical protein
MYHRCRGQTHAVRGCLQSAIFPTLFAITTRNRCSSSYKGLYRVDQSVERKVMSPLPDYEAKMYTWVRRIQ